MKGTALPERPAVRQAVLRGGVRPPPGLTPLTSRPRLRVATPTTQQGWKGDMSELIKGT